MSTIIMGFRETFEAILVISAMILFLKKNKLEEYIDIVYYGALFGVVISIVLALLLSRLGEAFLRQGEIVGALWGIGSSLVASGLMILLVITMIKNKQNINHDIQTKMAHNINIPSIFLLTVLMVAREGFELILFVLANTNKTNNGIELTIGILAACLLGFGLNKSMLKVNLKTLFKYLLIFLIFQVGYLIGDAVHELIELLEDMNIALNSGLLYSEVFNLSGTFIDSENSLIGILLNGFLGWYSEPVILQFIAQCVTTFYLIYLYRKYP